MEKLIQTVNQQIVAVVCVILYIRTSIVWSEFHTDVSDLIVRGNGIFFWGKVDLTNVLDTCPPTVGRRHVETHII